MTVIIVCWFCKHNQHSSQNTFLEFIVACLCFVDAFLIRGAELKWWTIWNDGDVMMLMICYDPTINVMIITDLMESHPFGQIDGCFIVVRMHSFLRSQTEEQCDYI